MAGAPASGTVDPRSPHRLRRRITIGANPSPSVDHASRGPTTIPGPANLHASAIRVPNPSGRASPSLGASPIRRANNTRDANPSRLSTPGRAPGSPMR
jgi:hypothetical protein